MTSKHSYFLTVFVLGILVGACTTYVYCAQKQEAKIETALVGTQTMRKSQYPVNQLFLNRWSPRAMSEESITDQELMSLFEAARWAPSSYNEQPWRFIYAKRGTPAWNTLFNLMVPFNQSWAKNGAALVVVISRKRFTHNNESNMTHSFDTGAAWENLALQAADLGLVTHGMAGFDYEKARKDLQVPEDYSIEAMFVIGKPGTKESLPEELQANEKPSDRRPVNDFVFEGSYSAHE